MVSLNGARRAQDRKLPNRVYYDSALRLLDKSVLCGRIVGECGDFYSQYETGMRLLRVRALPSLHRHRHEIAQIAPQPDTKIEHNQLDTTRDSRADDGTSSL